MVRSSYSLTNGHSKSDIQIRTWTIQRMLAPLIHNMTSLVEDNQSFADNECCGNYTSRPKEELLRDIQESLDLFQEIGTCMNVQASDEFSEEITDALVELKENGIEMLSSSEMFVAEPSSRDNRRSMADCAKRLLFSVTRLLSLADMIDCSRFSRDAQHVLQVLKRPDDEAVKSTKHFNKNHFNYETWMKELKTQVDQIDASARRRQDDLINGNERDKVAILRSSMKSQMRVLDLASKIKAQGTYRSTNTLLARQQLCKSITDILDVCCNRGQVVNGETMRPAADDRDGISALQEYLRADIENLADEFEQLIVEYSQYPDKLRRVLESKLEDVIRDVGLLIDSTNVPEEYRQKITANCNNSRQIVQNILSSCLPQKSNKTQSKENAQIYLLELASQTNGLLKQLRKAFTDEANEMMLCADRWPSLVERSLENCGGDVDQALVPFQSITHHWDEIARLVTMFCELDTSYSRYVHLASDTLKMYTPQLIEATKMLKSRGKSGDRKAIESYYEECRAIWVNYAQLFSDTIDECCKIEDMMAGGDQRILDDITLCLKSADVMDREQTLNYGHRAVLRVARFVRLVDCEVRRYETGDYTKLVCSAMQATRKEGLPMFVEILEQVGQSAAERLVDLKDELIYVANQLYDCIRELRCAVLMNSALELPTDSEDMSVNRGGGQDTEDEQSRISSPSNKSLVSDNGGTMKPGKHEYIQREVMRNLPQAEMDQIEKQVKVLKKEKRAFDREVLKWDEKGNDIVMLAKRMCLIMMDMTDFTRGEGPLKGTMDVIKAATKISEYGEKLIQIATSIGSECVESQTKEDLLVYLSQISLFTHQLKITSKVKADVQNISGELIVSGLDSAISLITSAKNLMNAVISVVKASYIASTKYRKKSSVKEQATQQAPVSNSACNVQWHMKPPAKKPLLIVNQELSAKVKSDARDSKHLHGDLTDGVSRVKGQMSRLSLYH